MKSKTPAALGLRASGALEVDRSERQRQRETGRRSEAPG